MIDDMVRILLLFVGVPLLELALLIGIGSRIGTILTLILIVATGILGAFLARRQGLGVLRDMQSELAQGRLPAGPLADGVIILLAAAVLITPGVLTDALGFMCLIPGTRGWIKAALWRRLKRAVQRGQVTVFVDLGETGGPPAEKSRQGGAGDSEDRPRHLRAGVDNGAIGGGWNREKK
jgi:UPF0716 protein FxsA